VQSEANYKSAQVLIEQEKLRLDEQRLALEARKVALAEAQAHADAAMQAARYVDEKSDKEQAMMMAMATQPVMEPEHREPPPPQVIVVPSGNGASVRNVVVQRGPDGRIIGAQMVEQPV
jgi:RES domain-containing protein